MSLIAGRPAVYHGSLVAHHGPCVPVELCDCDPCWEEWGARCAYAGQVLGAETGRWVLRLANGTELHHVRAASFTPAEPIPDSEPAAGPGVAR